ncbi:uncharacterized protein KY384_001089 [Bacidia gigantensis]|uniref:uncharacterized protein n=1 Tax=Bacidia gigantensis TaxID=2732470 RepID=UPI001D03CE9D|nr:uncharacterized protein KY384_001089 [Bacidia gigantensis]KAG8534245.1 hypothetical protein KY384_001089 [Bacidia gigantensis]
MARMYLTSAKISLLALICVYTEAVVPAEATIPILSFLLSQVLLRTTTEVESADDGDSNTCIPGIIVLQRETIAQASGIPGRTIWDLLLNRLWEIDSLDALHVYFENLSFLLKDESEKVEYGHGLDPVAHRMRLAKTSPLGMYVRKNRLEFSRLHFHDSLKLWQAFVAYRLPSFSQWKKRNPNSRYSGFDINLDNAQAASDTRLTPHTFVYLNGVDGSICEYSTEDMAKLVEFQINKIQSSLPNILTWPAKWDRFLEAWKTGDYSSSFDHLHRYFDYTMHNRDQVFYQYALLNLAALHADFGALEEAIVAMHETVSTARAHHDLVCLNYSLSWLYHFGKAHTKAIEKVEPRGGTGMDREALTFLKAKAKESNMWCVFTTAVLAEAKLALSNPGTTEYSWSSDINAFCYLRPTHHDLDAADQILNQLFALKALGHEVFFGIALLEIELQVQRQDFSSALGLLEQLAKHLEDSTFDMSQRISLMCVKARILEHAGTPQKGLSVALRAATFAQQAMILPVLWEAVGAICAILHSVGVFEESVGLLESIMPQVLESENCDLSGRSFSLLADAHVGLAGRVTDSTKIRKEQLSRGLENLDRAFDEYSKVNDVKMQCRLLAKKATIMNFNEDPMLANDCASQYLAIKKGAKNQSYV